MTATTTLQRSSAPSSDQWSPESDPTTTSVAIPPPSPTLQLIRAPLVVLLLLSGMLLIQIVLISSSQHSASQKRAFDRFRSELAKGIVPIGPTDSTGKVLSIGRPVAFLEIPTIGLEEVIGEGTTPSALFAGPGHRRDTPLPGQIGTSVVFGRRAAFGGPFSRIDHLGKGDVIKVTTGQGVFEFRVRGVRFEGDPVPPPPEQGSARLVLTTATGAPFLPDGAVRVDADLDGTAVVGPAPIVDNAHLPAEEKLMASDTRTLWALALWLQALIVLSVAGAWAWHRWGRAQTWVVFLPPLMVVCLFASGEVARLLPNLM
jgi:sortase A